MYCHNCGKENAEDAKFCFSCGCPLEAPLREVCTSNKKQKNVLIALALGGTILIVIVLLVLFSKKAVPEPVETSTASSESRREKESAQEAAEQDLVAPPSTSPSVESSAGGISPASFILPESNSRVYSTDELKALNAEQLRFARNEIFARHGRKFTSEDLHSYFSAQPWYTPKYEAAEFDALGDSVFNEFEIANQKSIAELENPGGLAANNSIVSLLNQYNYAQKIFTIDFLEPLTLVDKGEYFEITAELKTNITFPVSEIEKKKIGDSVKIQDEWHEITDISTSEYNSDWKYYSLSELYNEALGLGKSTATDIYTVLGANDLPVQMNIYTGPVRILKNTKINFLYGGNPDENTTTGIVDFFKNLDLDALSYRWLLATFNDEGYVTGIEEKWIP